VECPGQRDHAAENGGILAGRRQALHEGTVNLSVSSGNCLR
jgi:hypothetical protein